jgi:hypothetical protein
MKSKLSILVWIALATGLVACDKESVLPTASIPAEITAYANTHFPSLPLLQVVKENDGFVLTYNVILQGNIDLEFNRRKEIIEIDGVTALPSSVIPDAIETYVSTNFPDNFITNWALENKGQQVQLDNGLDLKFDMDGNFKRYDD